MSRTLTLLGIALAAASLAIGQESQPNPSWDIMRKNDADGDGKVSLSEYPRGETLFRRVDRDGDGFLTERDFRSGPRRPGAPLPPREPKPAEPMGPSDAADPAATPTAEGVKFFESKIRPVLATHCYACHSASATNLKGGLRLDTRDRFLQGGESGPAIVPGDPKGSTLLQALRYEGPEMPPKGKLSAEVIHDFETWVKMGAPDPRTEEAKPGDAKSDLAAWKRDIDYAEAKKFWSFQPVAKPEPPSADANKWAFNDVDRFVLAGLESHGLAPSKDAARGTWIRRVTFDLTGLPPTPGEIAAFEKDQAPDAYEKVVDRLLASPRFGERWGRHWLDVARYAESSGKESNVLYPHAWRYRDWVIEAFNDDKPYDLFLREQIAGDLMPSTSPTEKAKRQIATGFLAIGPKGHRTRNAQQFAMDVADEQIDATTQAMLGLTVACARCHDHKFDPIPTEDYYALAGVFLSSKTQYGTLRFQGNQHPSELIELPAEAAVPDGAPLPAAQRALIERQRERVKSISEGGVTRPGASNAQADRVRMRFASQQLNVIDALLSRFDEQGRPLPENRRAMGVAEARRPKNARVLVRGEIDRPGDTVPRGFVKVLTGEKAPAIAEGSGRLELAAWIASPDNPLTARVMVNRVWLHLFGKGIVQTPDNFGKNGQPPTHPELLDWLAASFVSDGWSVKKLIRKMALSHTYRMASDFDARKAQIDPADEWLWRMPKRRLEGEAIRDAMLAAAGTLILQPPVGSPVGTLEGDARVEQAYQLAAPERPVRSVYLPVVRDAVPEALEVFDFAEPSFVTGIREVTNVATQALFLMNDGEVIREAEAFADRLLAEPGTDDARIAGAFRLALGRAPSASDLDAARTFLAKFQAMQPKEEPPAPRRSRRGPPPRPRASADPRRAAWAAFCQTLFASAEFRYVD
jgi:cytochrome c553